MRMPGQAPPEKAGARSARDCPLPFCCVYGEARVAVSEAALERAERADVLTTCDWLQSTFLEGGLCTYVAPAVRQNLLLVGYSRSAEAERFEECLQWFCRWASSDPPSRMLRTAVIVMPRIGEEALYDVVRHLRADVHSSLATAGYLVGRFHPCSCAPSLQNGRVFELAPLQRPPT